MILRNLSIYGTDSKKTIHIENGKIRSVADSVIHFPECHDEALIHFDEAIALPGFINSHDHLDFNLFPQLGNGVYKNYRDWGHDIHQHNKDVINQVLKVPETLRIRWGLYKNLLNGVTTVVNHGKKIRVPEDLINVLQPASLHSPAFEKNWKWKLNNSFFKGPLTMHIGEGTDVAAEKEIDEVIQWNVFRKKFVAVHGVGMNEKQASSFYGLVWCPASNYFLLNKTAEVEKLADKTKIVFGTDSTLTASWNMWEHFRAAKRSVAVTEDKLIEMLTAKPAQLWGLNDVGKIADGKNADIVVLKTTKDFFSLNPEDILLVMIHGRVLLMDEIIRKQMRSINENGFDHIEMNGHIKFLRGNISELIQQIGYYYPKAIFPFLTT